MIRRNIGCELTPPVPAAVSSGKPPGSGCRGDAERAPVLMQPTLWNEKELKPPTTTETSGLGNRSSTREAIRCDLGSERAEK